jgi:biopolymer transport protein TolR
MAGFKSPDDSGMPVAEINITPLVDVMLVLLVIFMVTAPMMERGIPLQLPKATAKALPKAEPPLTVSLSKDTRVYIGKEEVPFSQLGKKVASHFGKKAKKEVFIRADGTLPYAFVAQAMAAIKNAGIDRIGLVTAPPENEAAPAAK